MVRRGPQSQHGETVTVIDANHFSIAYNSTVETVPSNGTYTSSTDPSLYFSVDENFPPTPFLACATYHERHRPSSHYLVSDRIHFRPAEIRACTQLGRQSDRRRRGERLHTAASHGDLWSGRERLAMGELFAIQFRAG